ncbi:MAG TPA: carbamoyltransferase C-terminal domain-containing protein [Ilumatobacteraceae bacterium]
MLGVNAVFHDPAAALVIDGEIVAAAEEERFNRRKHGKDCVPFSTWELPQHAMRWCLKSAGVKPGDLDAVGYSYDPSLCTDEAISMDAKMLGRPGYSAGPMRASFDPWEALRTMYAARAEEFAGDILPGLPSGVFRHVQHHTAHAASAYLAAPFGDCAVLVLDGRGEITSHLAGVVRDGKLDKLAAQVLPQSVGLLYEEVTAHLGFRRSSDEFKVMALASYGDPDRFADAFRPLVRATGNGGFAAGRLDLEALVPARMRDEPFGQEHADLAAAVQRCTEDLMLSLARWLHDTTGQRNLAMAGGVALNCVANGRLAAEGPFDEIWVQPAAGDSGTALGAALWCANELGDRCRPMPSAALGPEWSASEIAEILDEAEVRYSRPDNLAATTADALVSGAVVGWHAGRSEFGPRALGHRSLLVDPRRQENLQRMNQIKGREEFRPVAPMVLLERAAEIFDGKIPSPHMQFVHRVRDEWRDRIPAAIHVDGTARIQTVDRRQEPLMAAVLDEFEKRTGVPVVINTSFNTAGRPMVDSPIDALECFGASPIDLLVLAPFAVARKDLAA